MIPYIRFLFLCFHAVIFIFYFSDNRNEDISTKTLTTSHIWARVPRAQFINIVTYPGWLELPLTGTNFLGPKPVIEVLL